MKVIIEDQDGSSEVVALEEKTFKSGNVGFYRDQLVVLGHQVYKVQIILLKKGE